MNGDSGDIDDLGNTFLKEETGLAFRKGGARRQDGPTFVSSEN